MIEWENGNIFHKKYCKCRRKTLIFPAFKFFISEIPSNHFILEILIHLNQNQPFYLLRMNVFTKKNI